MEQYKRRFNRVSEIKYVSIFDTIDRGFTTKNYCDGVPPPDKNQITGRAMQHMLKFINECLIEKEVNYEFKKSKLE